MSIALQAAKDGREAPPIARKTSYVAMRRKSYVVWQMNISQVQRQIMLLLADGMDLVTALSKLARFSEAESLTANIRAWFKDWIEEGLFRGVEVR
ncbi:MAG: hypothetical protein HY816_05540 [Candidatus Wallbacteria bacterium]|nr:hypothetical protein [Candidatus Wallbacteria bacterium]